MKKLSLPSKVLLERCVLKMMRKENASDLLQVVTDDDARNQIDAFREINNFREALSFIEKFQLVEKKSRASLWGIYKTNEKLFMGLIGIVDLQDEPSIFYALLPDYRHEGVMTECVRWLTDFLHDECGKIVVVTEVHEDNVPSKNVLLRCGYKYDSVRKLFCCSAH